MRARFVPETHHVPSARMPPSSEHHPSPPAGQERTSIPRIAFLALAGALIVHGLLQRGRPWLVDGPLWDLQDSGRLKDLILALCRVGVIALLGYAVLGVCAAASQRVAAGRTGSVERAGGAGVACKAFGLALLAVLLVSVMASIARCGPGLRPPNALDLLPAAIGGLPGCWIGLGLSGARGRVRRVLIRSATASLIGAALIAVAAGLAIESKPLPFETARLTSDERVRLTRLIRSHSPRVIPPGRTVTLTLTGRDVNLLLAWGLSLGSEDRKARVELEQNEARLLASIRLPVGGASPNYLNATVGGRASMDDGRLRLDVTALQVGRVRVPRVLLWLLSPGLADRIASDPRLKPALDQIERVEIAPTHLAATYGKIDMPEGFRNDIFGEVGPNEQVVAAMRAQFERISRLGRRLPPPDERFATFLQAAFRLAHERSASADPVVENRAAVIALGIALGHDVIGEFVTGIPGESVPPQSLRLTRMVPLRGRVDWSRHFLVSAALAVLSTEGISYDIGLLKEELDAGGGSGFSFADLAADRAGTRFGHAATRDEVSARAMQQRLAGGFDVDAFVPVMADLPEGLQDDRLEAEYGGTTGQRYRALLAEIDRRIEACAGYK
ncbi:MAG: hypothetical protein C4547_13425 [Phycisphaerales bacterium]|nr:MAG: hypothetical protein C4547_13425 [Phycisphaerales bacterium]